MPESHARDTARQILFLVCSCTNLPPHFAPVVWYRAGTSATDGTGSWLLVERLQGFRT
jgi:hypothetical protein